VARSIHETRRDLEEARRWEFSDASRKGDSLRVIEDCLGQKRRYKDRRARPASAHANVPADADWTVDVVVHDQLPGVFQPLSAEDVRGLLSTFPVDVGAELRSVHLRLGRLEDDMKQDGAEPDPMTVVRDTRRVRSGRLRCAAAGAATRPFAVTNRRPYLASQ
jgi:hypothetical protein